MSKTEKKPYVVCHMFTSIDGKILAGRWKHLSIWENTRELYDKTAGEYDIGAWFVGTTTMREFFKPARNVVKPPVDVPPGDYIADPDAETLGIATDAHGSIEFNDNEVGGDHLVIIITEQTSAAYRAHLREQKISYIIAGEKDVDLALAVTKVASHFNVEKLLLEGGGLINGSMLKDGLIDEISLLIAPVADGGGASISSLFDLRGNVPGKAAVALKLLEQRTLKHGVQWLRYRVRKS